MEKRQTESKVELRAHEGGKEFIEGYGVIFNKRSVVLETLSGLEFREIIAPEAFNNTDFSGTIARANHSNSQLLGTSKGGTLQLRKDDIGIFFSIENPDTSVGRDLKIHMERGDITGSSFAFPIDSKSKIMRDSNGMLIRTVTEITRLGDIGPVISPAFTDTTAVHDFRNIDEFVEQEKRDSEESKEKPAKTGLSLANKIKLERLR